MRLTRKIIIGILGVLVWVVFLALSTLTVLFCIQNSGIELNKKLRITALETKTASQEGQIEALENAPKWFGK